MKLLCHFPFHLLLFINVARLFRIWDDKTVRLLVVLIFYFFRVYRSSSIENCVLSKSNRHVSYCPFFVCWKAHDNQIPFSFLFFPRLQIILNRKVVFRANLTDMYHIVGSRFVGKHMIIESAFHFFFILIFFRVYRSSSIEKLFFE